MPPTEKASIEKETIEKTTMKREDANQELLSQTAKISWQELERFFAAGKLIYVSLDLDLIEVGSALMRDNKTAFEAWTTQGLVHPVNDEQAIEWSEAQPTFWASALAPWVLIQDIKAEDR